MFRMIRRWGSTLRRWWAKRCHRHEWVVIHRSETRMGNWHGGKFRVESVRPSVLERCTCGQERARQWTGWEWIGEDLEYYNDWLARQEIELPARHQE